ncbi:MULTISPECIES: hypothetical protein [unclassified Moorena]|nr:MULTISPECIES: hypothetical protein [unclassified Moorena]NEO14709.1 hypothetical protein [Moorena sp. SIO3E8]NEQ01143.1 hypothetical protein [Moorena sp. SIO3F7]
MANRPRYANNRRTLAYWPRYANNLQPVNLQPVNLPFGNAKGEQHNN